MIRIMTFKFSNFYNNVVSSFGVNVSIIRTLWQLGPEEIFPFRIDLLSQLTYDCIRWFTDLYKISRVRPQGQCDTCGIREQVALQTATDDFPGDQVGGSVHLSSVPCYFGDHQHLLMDHRHFPQVPHFRRIRRIVTLISKNKNK